MGFSLPVVISIPEFLKIMFVPHRTIVSAESQIYHKALPEYSKAPVYEAQYAFSPYPLLPHNRFCKWF